MNETVTIAVLAYATLLSAITAALLAVWKASEANEARRRAAEAEAHAREAAQHAWECARSCREVLRDTADLEAYYSAWQAAPESGVSRPVDEPIVLAFTDRPDGAA